MLKRLGLRESAVHKLRMAGHDGMCTDWTPLAAADFRNERDTAIYHINCSFGDDLHLLFNGTPNAIPDFYEIVSSAENIGGKQN